ncbi:MAG: transposase, partial [Terriglobia bacterium]
PPQAACQVRAILRHRDNLVHLAATHVQHMQKALNQMNLQLHHVISDLTGTTGLAILDAILKGERNPQVLAELRDPRIQAAPETIANSLIGDYRPEHLFVLRQSLASYRAYQAQILDCDKEIQAALAQFETQADPNSLPPSPKKAHKPQRNQFHFNMRAELHRVFGVDLTAIPGVKDLSLHVLLSEAGPDLSAFPTEGDFDFWLGLCPNLQITGGRVLSSRTRKVRSRLARALRMAAQSLDHSQSYFGAILPSHARQTRPARSDNHRRPQAGSDHLPPPENSPTLRRLRFRARRRASPPAHTSPARKASQGLRFSIGSSRGTNRMTKQVP